MAKKSHISETPATAWLKAHYPAAFYTALLNNQPMGFYHPATLVKDAQRRGVRFAPIVSAYLLSRSFRIG